MSSMYGLHHQLVFIACLTLPEMCSPWDLAHSGDVCVYVMCVCCVYECACVLMCAIYCIINFDFFMFNHNVDRYLSVT